MKFTEAKTPGVFLLAPDLFQDDRGVFRRNYCVDTLAAHDIEFTPVQCNISENIHAGTLRGFHFQARPKREDKILTVMSGKLLNVVVDLRPSSPHFLKWEAFELDSRQRQSLLVPKGCANAFLTLAPDTTVLYYMSERYHPELGRSIRYNDPLIGVQWPAEPSVISEKDKAIPDLTESALASMGAA